MKNLRLFIAINLDNKLKEQISRIIMVCQKEEDSIKWVEPQNLHITLKFLGDIPEDNVEKIKKTLYDTGVNHRKFSFNLNELGVFPNAKQPRIIWIGISDGRENLLAINKDLEEKLEKIGIAREEKGFKCHITLGRVKKFKKVHNIEEILEKVKIKELMEQKVETIDLVKSTLHPSGPVYEVLERYLLV